MYLAEKERIQNDGEDGPKKAEAFEKTWKDKWNNIDEKKKNEIKDIKLKEKVNEDPEIKWSVNNFD